jgi:hypothetical protein
VKGNGVEKDMQRALMWCRKAAEEGYAHAQQNLAGMYMNGSGVERDLNQAAKWLQKAARQCLWRLILSWLRSTRSYYAHSSWLPLYISICRYRYKTHVLVIRYLAN